MKSLFRTIFKISLILTILAGCATTEEINETDPDSHLTQGTEYTKKGQNDRSIADFNKAIELNRRDAMPYFNRGFVYGEKARIKLYSLVVIRDGFVILAFFFIDKPPFVVKPSIFWV